MAQRHFVLLLSHNQPKNALQREAVRFLTEESNRIVSDSQLYLSFIKRRIADLNASYPRCSELCCLTYGMNSISVSLGEHFTVGFHLYPIKEAA